MKTLDIDINDLIYTNLGEIKDKQLQSIKHETNNWRDAN